MRAARSAAAGTRRTGGWAPPALLLAAAATAFTGFATTSCDYPSFQFDTHGSGAGAGSSSGDIFDAGPQVPCLDKGRFCDPAQVCCFSSEATCDVCADGPDEASCKAAAPPACGVSTYSIFSCASDDDCNPGAHCCGKGVIEYYYYTPVLVFTKIACATSCDPPNNLFQMCQKQTQCSSPEACTAIGYAGYGYCK